MLSLMGPNIFNSCKCSPHFLNRGTLIAVVLYNKLFGFLMCSQFTWLVNSSSCILVLFVTTLYRSIVYCKNCECHLDTGPLMSKLPASLNKFGEINVSYWLLPCQISSRSSLRINITTISYLCHAILSQKL